MTTAVLPGFKPFGPSPNVRVGGAVIAALGLMGLIWVAAGDVHPNPLFHPHGYCYLWQPSLVSAHLISDVLIGLSYLAISITLAVLVFRARRAIPFGWMFLAFGAFIVACGATHFMEVWTLWQPVFWTAAGVKIVTAVASVGTAIALPPLVPRILTLLESATVSETRRIALERAKEELERRVAERTGALESAVAREHDLRREAEAASRIKDEFLGLVSHELRTPLNAILGWSSMLTQSQLSDEQRTKGASAIERNARVQAQLIDDLLDTSRVVVGKLRINRDPVAVAPVVQAAVETIRPTAESKAITIEFDRLEPDVYVVGDAQRVQQMVWNLLSNAVKFTNSGGQVVVSVGRDCDASEAQISVRDTGIGIDPGFMPHVFTRFAQADSSPTRNKSGLGLGLSLVRHLAELHGGHVAAVSEGTGRGATFTIQLPALSIVPRRTTRRQRHDDVPDLRDARVLVVDDDPEALEMLRDGLAQFGAIVVTAGSADEARGLLVAETPDIIVSDLAMPEEDGFSFISELRARRIDIPAIALTAHVRTEDRTRVMAVGFQQYVSKPTTPLEIARAVGALRNAAT